MTQIDDPHAQREAQKYDNPIPSREFIMDHLRDRSGPATLKQVSFELALFEAEDVEALRRRLRAMERDGQLISDRKGAYGACLLYTSPSPRDVEESRMPSSA